MSYPVQVHVALYSKLHSGRPAGEDWAEGLPALWREAAIVPLDFRRSHEYEALAERVVGYDEAGAPCYSRYVYRHEELRSDDGEEFYEEILYAEIGRCWRLRDGRWLVWRRVERGWGEDRGFFSFCEAMPR